MFTNITNFMELFYSSSIKGENLLLEGSEAVHCCRVLRKREGDEIFAIDGEGGLYRCRITAVKKPVVEAVITEKLKGQGECAYNLTMAVCPTKNMERFEWFTEKAVELGVSRIVPLVSGHSIRTVVKKERLEAVALAATKQSLKAYLPVIESPIGVLDFLGDAPVADLKLIAHCESGEKFSIRSCIDQMQKTHRDEKPAVIIMIGPEGDFTKEEIDTAQAAGFKPITLGTSRLRVETAALAAVSEVYFGFQTK